jgi:hypothetical protein
MRNPWTQLFCEPDNYTHPPCSAVCLLPRQGVRFSDSGCQLTGHRPRLDGQEARHASFADGMRVALPQDWCLTGRSILKTPASQ